MNPLNMELGSVMAILGALAAVATAATGIFAWRISLKAQQTQEAFLKLTLPEIQIQDQRFKIGRNRQVDLELDVYNSGGSATGLKELIVHISADGRALGPNKWALFCAPGESIGAGKSAQIHAQINADSPQSFNLLWAHFHEGPGSNSESDPLAWICLVPFRGHPLVKTGWLHEGKLVRISGEKEARENQFRMDMNKYVPKS